MFRITHTEFACSILVVIEGQLVGSSIRAAEAIFEEIFSLNRPVTVFLKNVTEIDDHGHRFLRRLCQTKARLRALGIYTRYIIRKLQSA